MQTRGRGKGRRENGQDWDGSVATWLPHHWHIIFGRSVERLHTLMANCQVSSFGLFCTRCPFIRLRFLSWSMNAITILSVKINVASLPLYWEFAWTLKTKQQRKIFYFYIQKGKKNTNVPWLGNNDTNVMVTVGKERTGAVWESSIGGCGIYRYRDWAGITQLKMWRNGMAMKARKCPRLKERGE